jgi:eukaryotic-like serine/threonine-protein kinase
MEIRPGALIAGRFRVERKVGAGGMGEVWAGEQTALGVRVALKTLLPASACDPQLVARFKREAYLLGRIRSDYVARVVDFITDPEVGLVLVMEFVEGEPLSAAVASRKLSIEETIDLGIDLASGLCDLHRAQVVHRDLKPDNVLLQPQGDGRRRAIIVDFGVGKSFASELGGAPQGDDLADITHADMAVGTIAYMAPEQLLDSHGVTGAADVYALGAILYRAVSGQQVFGSLDDVEYAKKKLVAAPTPLPLSRFDRAARGLQAAVERALARNPADRFATAEAMRQELLLLRDVARGLAMDLEAVTDMAPLSEILGELATESRNELSTLADEPTTLNTAVALVDARSLLLIEARAELEAEVRAELEAKVRAELEAKARAAALVIPEPSPSSLVGPETVRTRTPPAPPPSRLALVLATLSGLVIGILAHWAFVAALARP